MEVAAAETSGKCNATQLGGSVGRSRKESASRKEEMRTNKLLLAQLARAFNFTISVGGCGAAAAATAAAAAAEQRQR